MKESDNPVWAVRVSKALVLIRILVGWVFVAEGIQKFLFPAQLGVGRFTKIGIPAPQVMAPFVGTVEIVCGTLLLLGFLTRLAAVPLRRHLRRHRDYQTSDDRENRNMEHAARGAYRLQHGTGVGVSPDRRSGIAVAGCEAARVGLMHA